jgi:hypothetical protein
MLNALLYGLAAALALSMSKAASAAGTLQFPKDGWVSWDVASVDKAPAWCCFADWQYPGSQHNQCDLERKHHSVGTRDGETTDTMRLYAYFTGGSLTKLRAYAPSCAVKTASAPTRLGDIEPDTSARWLGQTLAAMLAEKTARASSAATVKGDGAEKELRMERDLLAALALHRGTAARDLLVAQAKSGERKLRKEAIFWIGQTRGNESADMLSPFLFEDADAKIREHAAFSLSQTKLPRAVSLLIRQGETDREAKVRSQAWFWLAQTQSHEAEAAINRAVRKDPEKKVRHQAIFALSQLPSPRSVNALTAVAEDRTLDRDDRKQALFWLGQNGSEAAMAYIDRVLTSGK